VVKVDGLDEGPSRQGRRQAGAHEPGEVVKVDGLDEGPSRQGRRPGETHDGAERRPASMKGRPVRDGDRPVPMSQARWSRWTASMKGRPVRDGDRPPVIAAADVAPGLDEGPSRQGRRPDPAAAACWPFRSPR